MNCTNCGKPLDDGAKFCAFCGKAIQQPKKVCPTCGKEFEGDRLFCNMCGTALKLQGEPGPADDIKQIPSEVVFDYMSFYIGVGTEGEKIDIGKVIFTKESIETVSGILYLKNVAKVEKIPYVGVWSAIVVTLTNGGKYTFAKLNPDVNMIDNAIAICEKGIKEGR